MIEFAEELAQACKIAAVGEQADAIAELEHEVGPRHDVGVAAPDMADDRRFGARQLEVADRPAHHQRAGGEDAYVVEVAAILGHATGRRLSKNATRLGKRFRGWRDDQHDVVFRHDEPRRSWFVVMRPAQGNDMRAGRQAAHHLADGLAEVSGIAQGDLEQLHAGAGAGLDLRLEDHVAEVEEKDRPGDAERVGDRIADGRIVVAKRGDGGLQGRRTGARSGKQAEPVAQIETHRFRDGNAHHARQEDPDQRHDVGPLSGDAREAEEELLAVLNSDGIEEQGKADRADHWRRHRLRRKPAHGERDKQHRADAEREAFDVDLAHEVTDRDREEHCRKRLLLQEDPDVIHARLPAA